MTEFAYFAAGCFWGVERYFNKEFGSKMIKTTVGYIGGSLESPTYRQVCTGTSGHAEAVRIEYDPKLVQYEDLVTYFWRIHDPTTLNSQGNDQGPQYRSAIFYTSEAQKETAEKVKKTVQKYFKNPIVTEIVAQLKFYSAEEYHQKYLDKNPAGYCNHYLRW